MAQKSWRQLVKSVDPDVDKREVAYEWSNGKKFKQKKDPYES
jgi:hypothetical protein